MHKNININRKNEYKIKHLINDLALVKELHKQFSDAIVNKMSSKRSNIVLSSDDEGNETQETTLAKKKKGNKTDLMKKMEELEHLETLLEKETDKNEIIRLEQQILSDKKIIEAISICNEFKEQKKLEKNKNINNITVTTRGKAKTLNQIFETNETSISTQAQTNQNQPIKLNGKQNNSKTNEFEFRTLNQILKLTNFLIFKSINSIHGKLKKILV